jgi:hypothetical protein
VQLDPPYEGFAATKSTLVLNEEHNCSLDMSIGMGLYDTMVTNDHTRLQCNVIANLLSQQDCTMRLTSLSLIIEIPVNITESSPTAHAANCR